MLLSGLRNRSGGPRAGSAERRRKRVFLWQNGGSCLRLIAKLSMQTLTDREIRLALVASLERRAKAPSAVLQEVHVCNGNAIVDVVAVYKALHCYEIKGETDSIHRLRRQVQFYDQAAPIASLVTTSNHLAKALEILPAHWGVIVAQPSVGDSVKFRQIRRSSRNPLYRPEIALLSLWRSELVGLQAVSDKSLQKLNRHKLVDLVVSSASVSAINEAVGRVLSRRERPLTTLDSGLPCTLCERRSSVSESLTV